MRTVHAGWVAVQGVVRSRVMNWLVGGVFGFWEADPPRMKRFVFVRATAPPETGYAVDWAEVWCRSKEEERSARETRDVRRLIFFDLLFLDVVMILWEGGEGKVELVNGCLECTYDVQKEHGKRK